MRRGLDRALLAAAAAAVLLPCCRGNSPERPFRAKAGTPFILVSVDTLRADHLPAYGYKGVETPRIDAFRQDAILFQNAFSQVPLTLPSHISLLTGQLPGEHGVRDNLGYRFSSATSPTIPSLLKAQGYATGAAVSAYVLRGATGLSGAFDFYDDVEADPAEGGAVALVRRRGDETVSHALKWLRGVGQEPFFLFVHLYEPHFPCEPPEPFKSRYPIAYDGAIAAADSIVGAFFDALRREGIYDKSLIALVSDHGEGLGDHGEEGHGILLYREVLKVPLLLKLPGSREAGSSVEAPVALVDLLPTAADVLGFPPPKGLKGTSLLRAKGRSSRIYSETYYARIHLGWSELRSLVDSRYHFIDGPKPELYDLEADGGERTSVLEKAQEVAASRKRELDAMAASLRAPERTAPEEAEGLRALGYLGGGDRAFGASGPQRPNPKDHIKEHEAMQAAFRLARLGKDEEAVRAFEALLRKDPDLFDVEWELGTTLSRLGRDEAAARTIERAMTKTPSMAGLAAVSLAQVEVRLGRLDKAAAHAAAGLEADPAHAHEVLARVALQQSDLDRATREAELARASDPSGSTLLPEIWIRQGRLEAALRELDRMKALADGRPRPNLEFLRGDALARLKRNVPAEAAFRQEIADFPRNSDAYASLAILLAAESDPRGEVDEVLEAMVRANRSPRSALLAARTLDFLGDAEGARRWRARARP